MLGAQNWRTGLNSFGTAAGRASVPLRRQMHRVKDIARRPRRFLLRVLRGFGESEGLLLAGAVAYNSLLSIIPLFALVLLGLSNFVSRESLLATLATDLSLIVPGRSEVLLDQIEALLEHREVVSLVVVGVLVVFSAIAFGVLQQAMAVIFHHRPRKDRSWLVSVLIPYAFVVLLGLGMLLVTFIAGALQHMEQRGFSLFGAEWSLHGVSAAALYLLGVLGLMLMLTAFYLVMPVGTIAPRHALAGGITAGLLWELTRHLMVWYFSTLSLVNVVYGSLAGTVVALLSFEVGALILLFGAQVIAEFERHEPEASA